MRQEHVDELFELHGFDDDILDDVWEELGHVSGLADLLRCARVNVGRVQGMRERSMCGMRREGEREGGVRGSKK